MSDPNLFWTVFSAVLAAIILGGTFFWGMAAYSRHERNGTEHTRKANGPFLAVIAPLCVLALTSMVALDKVPAWLDYILQ